MAFLDVEQLTMRFGGLTAISQVSFSLERARSSPSSGPMERAKPPSSTRSPESTSRPKAIKLQGRVEATPFTGLRLFGWLTVGIITGLAMMLAFVNVDLFWRATFGGMNGSNFSIAQAASNASGYLSGSLGVIEERGRWRVVSPDRSATLWSAANEVDARKHLAALEKVVTHANEATPASREGKGAIVHGGETLIATEDEATATDLLATAKRVEAERSRRKLFAWIGLLAGFTFGFLGAFTVWRRARRAPEVIARGGIARTFQNIRLFHNMTVLENVLMGRDRFYRGGLLGMAMNALGITPEESRNVRVAGDLLRFVGLQPKANMLAKNLPYGDQRRLEIARALATEPKLLLLDEPAAGMNPSESADLMKLIEQIRSRGITILLIEHHMNIVMAISDRIVVLDHGVKIAEGTAEEIRNNPAVIEAYLGKEEVS
ncbi:MAG: ATP-binding cassette domain-containing protein [Gemmataceae bacterium]